MSGEVLALAAGISFAAFQILHRRVGQFIDPYLGSFMLVVISLVVLGTACLLTRPSVGLTEATTHGGLAFAAAGLVHFVFGWTALTLSQRKIGAARTGSIMGAAPVMTAILAALFLGQVLTPIEILGIGVVVLGVWLVASDPPSRETRESSGWSSPGMLKSLRQSVYGLLTALSFAVGTILVRVGLDGMPSPLLGSTLGLGVSAVFYGFLLAIVYLRRKPRWYFGDVRRSSIMARQGSAGLAVALGTLLQYAATLSAPAAVVVALGRVNVPLVVAFSPFLIGRGLEPLTKRLLGGAALVLVGALVLVL
jgi:drug/metabolite transporter (DMT)-like permease